MIRFTSFTKVVFLLCLSCMLLSAQQKEQPKTSTKLAPRNQFIERTIVPTLTGSTFWQSKAKGYVEEGFELDTFPPTGWTSESVLGAKVWNRSTTYPNSGVAAAFVSYEQTGGEDWLITPGITVGAGGEISFYVRKNLSSNYPPDYLSIRVSTTNNSTASFTDELENIDVNALTTTYAQKTYSLAAYVGQTIYIAFKHTDTDGNGVYIDDVKFGTPPLNDAGVLEIGLPSAAAPGTLTPKATIKNFGSNSNSFGVTLTIGTNYTSTMQVTNLAGGATQEVTFDNVTLGVGEYEVTCTTNLTGDENSINDVLSQALSIQESVTIYGYQAYSPSLSSGTARFESINPGTFSRINVIAGDDFLSGSANVGAANGYGIFYTSSMVVSFDTSTGLLTNIGTLAPPTGANWLGMTYDPVTQKLYGTASDDADNSYIAEIDLQTLTHNVIATIPSTTIIGIACNGDGNIYGVELNTDVFGKYNIATATFSVIGPLGFNANYAQSLEFDYETGMLYFAAYNDALSTGELRVVDIVTGSSRLIGAFEGEAEVDGIFVGGGVAVPVELTLFEASKVDNSICLSWATATETNNDRFVVERKSETSNWSAVATVIGNGTSTERHEYSYMDNAISENETYYYRLKQIDYDGTFTYSKVVKVEGSAMPTNFTLNQNYPNPFNPSTVISYSMPVDGAVKLVVTNVLGQEVKELVNGQQTAGSYKINFNAQGLTSGIYFYNLNVKSATGEVFNQVKKMMYVK